jgi:hypothetical protein
LYTRDWIIVQYFPACLNIPLKGLWGLETSLDLPGVMNQPMFSRQLHQDQESAG